MSEERRQGFTMTQKLTLVLLGLALWFVLLRIGAMFLRRVIGD
jgi:hypothetical protein